MRVAVYLARSPKIATCFNGKAADAAILKCWSDSDWLPTRSTSGNVSMLANAAIGAVSRRQQCVSVSSTEAELMAMSVAACDIAYYKPLLHDAGVPQDEAIDLRADNKGANDLSHDYTTSTRSRHIERRWFKVREYLHKGLLKVIAVPTLDNISDFFTKALDRQPFEKFRTVIMGLPPPRSISFLGVMTDIAQTIYGMPAAWASDAEPG